MYFSAFFGIVCICGINRWFSMKRNHSVRLTVRLPVSGEYLVKCCKTWNNGLNHKSMTYLISHMQWNWTEKVKYVNMIKQSWWVVIDGYSYNYKKYNSLRIPTSSKTFKKKKKRETQFSCHILEVKHANSKHDLGKLYTILSFSPLSVKWMFSP